MFGKGHFRKILTQCFKFSRYHALIFDKNKLDFAVPEFNAESIGTILECQKSKTKKLVCSFYTGEYIAISSLTH